MTDLGALRTSGIWPKTVRPISGAEVEEADCNRTPPLTRGTDDVLTCHREGSSLTSRRTLWFETKVQKVREQHRDRIGALDFEFADLLDQHGNLWPTTV
jgi:hypothetical protein